MSWNWTSEEPLFHEGRSSTPCGFLSENKFAEVGWGAVCVWAQLYARYPSPPPPIYWNHRVSGKMQFDLWGSITCGQNLDVKELTGRIPDEGSPKRDDAM